MSADLQNYLVCLDENELLFAQGDKGDSCYIVKEGVLEVFITDEREKKLVLAMLREGEILGDMALILNTPRTASCRALTNCRLVRLTNDNLIEIIMKKPEFAVNLISRFRERLVNVNSKLVAIAKEKSVLGKVDDSGGEIVSRNSLSFRKGTIIFQEGDKGKTGYVIKSGKVRLVKLNRVQKKETEIAVLEPGEIFGELALIQPGDRTATAISDCDSTELIAFDEKNFNHMLYNDHDFCLKILRICCQRIKDMNEKLGCG